MAKHYFITDDARVFFATNRGQWTAARALLNTEGVETYEASDRDEGLADVPTKVLVALHNEARPERPVTRFSDRKTAERRCQGVVDLLAKDVLKILPEAVTYPSAKADKPAKAPKAPKAEATTPRGMVITDAELDEVITRRGKGESWDEIVTAMGKKRQFIMRVRPLMKQRDPSLVKPLGPGSPGYGTGGTKQPRATRARKRSDDNVTKEAF